MNTPEKVNELGKEARALLNTLQETFQVFRDCAPLAIGIDKQVMARLPEISRKTLRIALSMHTNSLRYLKTMEKATHRYDLDGNSGDEISEAHRQHASEVLRERFKKSAEQRKAQREAEERDRRHNAKLNQLVEKFARNK